MLWGLSLKLSVFNWILKVFYETRTLKEDELQSSTFASLSFHISVNNLPQSLSESDFYLYVDGNYFRPTSGSLRKIDLYKECYHDTSRR